MRWQDTQNQTCSIARAMAILGDRWTFLVIRQVFLRIRKFSEIQSTLGITKHRLSDRLNRLVEEGILFKKPYDESGTRFEYMLTEKGVDLYPILVSITQWGDRWLADADGKPIEYIHKTCGHPANPKVMCTHCNGEIKATNTFVSLSTGITNKLERGEIGDIEFKVIKRAVNL